MPLLGYEVRRFRDSKPSRDILCETHVARRKVIGYRFGKTFPVSDAATCFDCEAAREPTALDAKIEADDAAAKKAEPVPAKVLPGQRRLF